MKEGARHGFERRICERLRVPRGFYVKNGVNKPYAYRAGSTRREYFNN